MRSEMTDPGRRAPSWAAWLAAAGVVSTLATMAVLMLYAGPVADDFYRSGLGRTQGWRAPVASDYFGWSGRWSGVGLGYLILPRIDLMGGYPVLLGVLATFQALGLIAFWRTLLGAGTSRRGALGLAAVTMAVLWSSLPVPGETTFWATGCFEYQLSISLGLLLIGGLARVRWEELSGPGTLARLAGLCLLAFAVTGMHEILSLMACIVLTTGTAVAFGARQSARRGRAWLAVTLAALAGFVVVFAAPGNWNRASQYPRQGGLVDDALIAWSQAWERLPAWVLDVRLLAATLVLILSPSLARARDGWLGRGAMAPKLVVTAVWLLIVGGMFLGPSVIIHGPMPGRTLNATYTLFVLGWIASVVVWTRSPGATMVALEPASSRSARSAALAVLGLALLLSGNTRVGIASLWDGAPQEWNGAMRWRDRLIQDAARGGATHVEVPALDPASWPALYMTTDLVEDPAHWVNQHLTLHYGLEGIRRLPPGVRLPSRPEVVGLGAPKQAPR